MAIKRSIRLECTECHQINYLTFKNAKNHPDKMELRKYCPHCRKTTLHKETKKK